MREGGGHNGKKKWPTGWLLAGAAGSLECLWHWLLAEGLLAGALGRLAGWLGGLAMFFGG